MANPEQLDILKEGVEAWNAWRAENEGVKVDLSGADLIEADLNGADLQGADLNGAHLTEAAILFPLAAYGGVIMAQPIYLSREGLEKLQAELDYLRTVRRHEGAESIQQSRERGGTVSNAEYEDAKNGLAFTEGRILNLDNLINNAEIIEESRGPRDVVEVGATVTVLNQEGKTYQYTIMGSAEADPAQGKISNVSPIGMSLIGRKVSEVADPCAGW